MDGSEYSTGLFACFKDCGICCRGVCWPCLTGRNMAELNGFCCPSGFWTRRLIRIKYNIEPDEKGDCVKFCFCQPCAVCQDAREIKMRKEADVDLVDI